MSALESLKGRALRPGHPLYDASARAELDRRMAQIRRKKETSDLAMWEEGLHFLSIRDRKLFFQDGYTSMADWLAHKAKRARTTVGRRMRLAENFSKEQVARFGADILELVIAYAARTVAADEAWQLEQLVLAVPGPDGVEEVPFTKAEPWQVEAALAHQNALQQRRAANALPDTTQAFVDRLLGAVAHGERSLADIRGRPAESGHADDTELRITLRLGDLEAVISRLQSELSTRARKRG